jgi:metal-sulfur cluster biosynthetic enzyme
MQLTIAKVAVRRAQRQSNEDWNVPSPETKAIKVELVWDPPWTSDRHERSGPSAIRVVAQADQRPAAPRFAP